MTQRDDYYRSKCEYQSEYDATIDWIKNNNKYAPKSPDGAESFACKSVHDCISGVLFGNGGSFYATGGCVAIRLSSKPESEGFKKVVLAVSPTIALLV